MTAPTAGAGPVHARGCQAEGERPSQMLDGYTYCPECRRMIRTDS